MDLAASTRRVAELSNDHLRALIATANDETANRAGVLAWLDGAFERPLQSATSIVRSWPNCDRRVGALGPLRHKR
jgi:hypothetical protein